MEITEEDMKRIDSTTESPAIRANKVLAYLRLNETLTTWDVLCFIAEYTAMLSLEWPVITAAAKVISKFVYILHYVNQGFKDPISLNKVD